MMHIVALGGLVVIVFAIGPKVRGFKPGRGGYCDMSSLCSISIVTRQVLLRDNEFVAFP
jgi:hypothetical protein